MLKLLGFSPAFGLPDASPFVVKVDTYLRMTGLEYDYEGGMQNLKKAPKGKLPLLEDEGKIIPDSEIIIDYLKHEKNADLDYWLSDEQRAVAHLVIKSLDENLYWCLVYSRWVNQETWLKVKDNFFAGMSFPLKVILPPLLRSGVKSSIKKQGMGRHSEEEVLAIANKSFVSLEDMLGEKDYFFGDQPCSLDATVYGHVACFIRSELKNRFNQDARQYTKLVDFCHRIAMKY